MNSPHSITCARRIVRDIDASGGSKWEAVQAIRSHCGVSLLRAHRIAHGFTLVEVAQQLQQLLSTDGSSSRGLSHQSVSRWETGLDMPTYPFLDALCRLYRTRPDRLGFGHDYTADAPQSSRNSQVGVSASGPLVVTSGVPRGASVWETVHALEESLEATGYLLYVVPPSEYIPARMRDLARIQQLMLAEQSAELRRRLLRVESILAGLIAFRLNDVADIHDTFMWFYKARRAARQGGDTAVDAWLRGHMAHIHECYRHALDQGLAAARSAQASGGSKPTSASVFGLLSEGGIQARIGRRREAVEAITAAERMFVALPPTATTDNNLGTSEYILRWHQSHALASIGDRRAAEEARGRVLELPMAQKDHVGRALLDLDMAAMLERLGELDEASALIGHVWQTLPAELRIGQVHRYVCQLVAGLPSTMRDSIFQR
ncbi:helix-turn-helix transcriptional regulator [Nocardia terpenica]|nr:helix-turn-helix transcriptional regulator [Nocardia terpenica]MBF6102913.1 helix-turn-helix transcriptional regulator [Nocardia terpenica]MBF6110898.1 helix-turn-helix transcriptional regulator [Nocardia terpenica]MBF6117029.1 helix-turn-helix transcriptional regulator [Nocardia terpenica]MBF6151133.1 helix-turn-helix transcriptional regulator [Nocardia terpenica]